jgi:hypothetical protein
MFSYLRLKLQINRSSRKDCPILVNRGYRNLVMYFLLTCKLPIWLRLFSYKDVAACFENLIVLQRSLMCYNIVFKCGKDS